MKKIVLGLGLLNFIEMLIFCGLFALLLVLKVMGVCSDSKLSVVFSSNLQLEKILLISAFLVFMIKGKSG